MALIVPCIYDDTHRRWVANPDPLATRYPFNTTLLVADERCSFLLGDPNQPIPSDAFMTYRLDDAQPFNFLANRSLQWPENEWPCLTPDYHPWPTLNHSRDLGAEAYAAAHTLLARTAFEFAIWDINLRAEGAGNRLSADTLGRLWPPLDYKQVTPMYNESNVLTEYNDFRYSLILDLDEMPVVQPQPVVTTPVPPLPPAVVKPWQEQVLIEGPNPMGRYFSVDGRAWIKLPGA